MSDDEVEKDGNTGRVISSSAGGAVIIKMLRVILCAALRVLAFVSVEPEAP